MRRAAVAKYSGYGIFTNMELTVSEASQRLDVSPRRVRALVESGQLPAIRRGPMWLTTADAVDSFQRNSPGRGRPISANTAWSRIGEIARSGHVAALHSSRIALRSRALHRTYSLPERTALRFETPEGTFRSGVDALEARGAGDPIDLYVINNAAQRLLTRTQATPSANGLLQLHVLPPGMVAPRLSQRERLVLAWCDLADRADSTVDLATERLWPGSVEIPQLADVVRGAETVPYSALRSFTDWLQRHPQLTSGAIAEQPKRTEDRSLDSLVAAIAETVADDNDVPRPAWTRKVRAATQPLPEGTRRGTLGGEIPAAFDERGIDLPRDTFWHVN